jgi:hypothetical protein
MLLRIEPLFPGPNAGVFRGDVFGDFTDAMRRERPRNEDLQRAISFAPCALSERPSVNPRLNRSEAEPLAWSCGY